MKQFCVVIPVYKPDLDCIELIALSRLYEVIGKKDYDVILVIPELMDISNYEKIYPGIKYVEFEKKCFDSTATYSKLLISNGFYKSFDDFEYMLIYQLDCFLFKDEISDWCNKGYDYIGPPILSPHCGWPDTPRVGNGGFSLRKIQTFLDITDLNGEFLNSEPEFKDYIIHTDIQFEDLYYCVDLLKKYDLEMPTVKEAFLFGIDMNPDLVFDHLKYPYPMGGHSMDKNIRYWKYHLAEYFDKPEIIEYCENKHKDFFKLYYQDDKYSTILDEEPKA